MDLEFLRSQVQRIISAGLPCSVVIGDRTLTAARSTKKAEVSANLYGPVNSYTFSVLLERGSLGVLPRSGDRISVDGQDFRILSVTDNGGVTVTLDLRDV